MKSILFEIKIDERLTLIIPDPSLAPEIFSLVNKDRDHLRIWLPWVDSTVAVEDTRDNLSERIETFKNGLQAAFFGTLNGDIIASIGFVSVGETEGEIGYWLLSEHQGKGHMTSFVKACIDYGFDKLNLSKIVIRCAEGNIKSAAIPRRLGFTQSIEITEEGIKSEDEDSMLVFTLDRSEWFK